MAGDDGGSGFSPYWRFIQSEAYAAGAAVTVYGLFRLSAWATELIDSVVPVTYTEPIDFLAQVMTWGAVIGSAFTFTIITVYQLLILLKRLWAQIQ